MVALPVARHCREPRAAEAREPLERQIAATTAVRAVRDRRGLMARNVVAAVEEQSTVAQPPDREARVAVAQAG